MTVCIPEFYSLRNLAHLQPTRVPPTPTPGSLVYGTFWTVWERSTLLSRAVKQLTQLIVQAATMVNALLSSSDKGVHIYVTHRLLVILYDP